MTDRTFFTYLKDNRVLLIALVSIMGRYVSEVIDSIARNIIIPTFINKEEQDEQIEIYGVKMKLKLLILETVHFISVFLIVVFILFLLMREKVI